MTEEEWKSRRISRREFVKGAAAGAGALAGASALAGCGSAAGPAEECPPCPTTGPAAGYSFEVAPDPIPASEIKETVDADIVVVGAGIAGLPAAMAAAETGATVAVLEKGPTFGEPRNFASGFDTKALKAAGIELDKDEAIKELMTESGFVNARQNVVRQWMYRSGEAFDWLIDILAAAGFETTVGVMGTSVSEAGYWKLYPTAHMFGFPAVNWMEPLAQYAEEKGAVFHYSTPGVQLLREGSGPVTGIIGQNTDGDYIQFNASKGVILCTGGFARDPEMMEKYYPLSDRFVYNWSNPLDAGDGQKMGMWVGAEMEGVSGGNAFLGTATGKSLWPPDSWLFGWTYYPAVGNMPMLVVDVVGNRWLNEELLLPGLGANVSLAFLNQPGGRAWSVWDSAWESKIPGPVEHLMAVNTQEQLETDVAEGVTLKADSIDELAGKMNVPADTLKATIERYNELCAGGEDVDLLKSPVWMTTVDTPPFYAASIGSTICTTVGGLKIKDKAQVLDTEGKVIPGLYAAGETSGCRLGLSYIMTFPGGSAGPALTFGYLAAKNALAE
jgi:fumarate reductase flavoprotein subunit